MVNLSLVIVTYNRLEKLKKSLQHYDQQSAGFTSLIVVNNASIDGTEEFLSEWVDAEATYKKYVINLPENMGGSGGFYEGQKFALSLNPDWIYVADDDAYADKNMISEFYKFIGSHDISAISAVCAAVLNIDNTISYEHRSYVNFKWRVKFVMTPSRKLDYGANYFSIDLLSYVGSFLNVASLKKVGIVDHRFFIYADDGEHSFRLKQCGNILCVPTMKIYHDSGQNAAAQNNEIIVSWRDYYAIRNMLNMLCRYNIFAAIYLTLAHIKVLFTARDKKWCRTKLVVNAIVDAWLTRLGKHHLYRPGWFVNK